MTLPTFSVRERTITHENPTLISDGLVVCQEAFIQIDTTTMSQTFVHLLMHHMGEGHIRVKVARMKDDGITLTNVKHPKGKPAPDDLNPESLETVEIDLPEQEPVCPECKAKVLFECVACSSNNYPPKRPWVGLTDDQLADLWYKQSLDWMEFARAHEAALRSKNA